MKRINLRTALMSAPVWAGATAGAALLSPFGAGVLGGPERDAAAVVTLTAALLCRMAQDVFFDAED